MPKHDAPVQQVSRPTRVFVHQRPGEALLAYTRTFFFHASDPDTALYAARLIGETWLNQVTHTATRQISVSGVFSWLWKLPILLLGSVYGTSWSESISTTTRLAWQVLPQEVVTLRTGGHAHNYLADILVFQTGKTWSTGVNYLRATLRQDFAQPRLSLRPLLRALLPPTPLRLGGTKTWVCSNHKPITAGAYKKGEQTMLR